MIPAIVGLGATQINIFVNTNFAASCVEGSVSWLNYAFRLVQFPIGVFGVAVSIAAMPVISRCAAVKDIQGMRETYVSSLTLAFCLTIPATVGLFCLAEPVIRVIFEHGNFEAVDTVRTAEALSFYVLGLFAYASVKICVPVFYALNDTRYPVIGSFLAVAANITIIILSIDALQHRAMALSTSCAMALNFLFLSIVLYRKLAGYSLRYISRGLFKVCGASLVMWVWLFVLGSAVSDWMSNGLLHDIAGLLFLIISGALVYGVALYMTGLRELKVLVKKVGMRFRGL